MRARVDKVTVSLAWRFWGFWQNPWLCREPSTVGPSGLGAGGCSPRNRAGSIYLKGNPTFYT